jgi:hypothetical protein
MIEKALWLQTIRKQQSHGTTIDVITEQADAPEAVRFRYSAFPPAALWFQSDLAEKTRRFNFILHNWLQLMQIATLQSGSPCSYVVKLASHCDRQHCESFRVARFAEDATVR